MARQSPAAKRGKRKVLQAVSESTHEGGLHQSLGIPQGQKIPAGELQPKPSDSTKVKRQKALARTYAKYRP